MSNFQNHSSNFEAGIIPPDGLYGPSWDSENIWSDYEPGAQDVSLEAVADRWDDLQQEHIVTTDDAEYLSLADILPDEDMSQSVEVAAIAGFISEDMETWFRHSRITEREERVLKMRLSDDKPKPYREIGALLGVHGQRTRQNQVRALTKLHRGEFGHHVPMQEWRYLSDEPVNGSLRASIPLTEVEIDTL